MRPNFQARFRRFSTYPRKLLATFTPWQMLRFLFGHGVGQVLMGIRVRHFPRKVWLRPRSTDIRVLYEIFTTAEMSMEWPLPVPPQTIIDGGANVGYATLALRNRWPDASVLAVEPDERNAAVLATNLESLGRTQILKKGIWGYPCNLKVQGASLELGAWGLRFEPVEGSAGPDVVEAVSIPQLLDMLPDRTCDFLKLDVEGAELSIFTHGDLEWLNRVSAILVETHGPKADLLIRQIGRDKGFEIRKAGEKLLLWRA